MLDNFHLTVIAGKACPYSGDLLQHLGSFHHAFCGNVQGVAQRKQNRIVNAQHNGERDQHGQAAARHAYAFFFIELLGLHLQLHAVIRIDLLQLFDLLLHLRLRSHRLLLLHREREHEDLHDQGKEQNRYAVVLHDFIEKPQQIPQYAAKPVKNVHTQSPLCLVKGKWHPPGRLHCRASGLRINPTNKGRQAIQVMVSFPSSIIRTLQRRSGFSF